MDSLLEKVLNQNGSRIYNMIGYPGIGKSALVASLLHYISDRKLLRGGSFYFNARNFSMCEVFVRHLNQAIVS